MLDASNYGVNHNVILSFVTRSKRFFLETSFFSHGFYSYTRCSHFVETCSRNRLSGSWMFCCSKMISKYATTSRNVVFMFTSYSQEKTHRNGSVRTKSTGCFIAGILFFKVLLCFFKKQNCKIRSFLTYSKCSVYI